MAHDKKQFFVALPGTQAVQILAYNANRKTALMRNAGTQTVYLHETSGVSISNGFPLDPGDTLEDDRTTSEWWGVVETGTGDIRIIEVTW